MFYWYGDPSGPTVQHGYVYRTTDGGLTWIKSPKISDGYSIIEIKFFDLSNGFLNFSGVWKTQNGGETWTKTQSLGSTNMYFIDQNYGWINGIYTVALKFVIGVTTDGGNTWNYMQDVIPDVSHDINAIYFLDYYTGWAVGGNGTILKYYPPAEDSTGYHYIFNAVLLKWTIYLKAAPPAHKIQ